MTKTLETAFEEAKTLLEDRHEKLSQWVRNYFDQERSSLALYDEQQAEVHRRMDEPNPVFATDRQVAALFRKFSV